MPFVGIIAKENDSNFIKSEILQNAKNNKFEFVFINKKSIENVKNIKFELLIINEDIKDFIKASFYLKRIFDNAKYIIVNSDVKNNLKVLEGFGANIITYGLNAKSSITVSSINEENILICIQRNIKTISEKIIEEQEFNIEIGKNNLNKIYNVLAVFVTLKIYGEILQKI